MILTCPECHVQYNVDPQKLGDRGKTVRCISCRHTWFQALSEQRVKEEAPPLAPPPPKDRDEVTFDSILAGAHAPSGDLKAMDSKAAIENILAHKTDVPVLDPAPMGVKAGQFGLLVFLFLFFITALPMFTLRDAIVSHRPQMALLYKTLGFDVHPPGAGLRLGSMTAERRIDKKGRMLVVSAKVANLTSEAIVYPRFVLRLKEGHTVIREYDFHPEKESLPAGESAPLMLSLEDAPEEATAADIVVREKS